MRANLRMPVVSLAFVAVCATGVIGSRPASLIVGSQFAHVARSGETWASLGARYGIEPVVLAAMNARLPKAAVKAGETIRVDNRHLVPAGLVDNGITINVPQRLLFVVRDGIVVAHYPVGLGRASWPTFVGPFVIRAKELDPVWDVPVSIQEEQRRQGKKVLTQVGPGPSNPLGKYWLGLSAGSYGIHGTTAPLSIYQFQSHGCIRLHPDDIEALFNLVHVGMSGATIYEPVLLYADGEDILLEAHRDVYRRAADAYAHVATTAGELGVHHRIDWNAVAQILNVRDGVPHPVQLTDTSMRER